MSRFLSSFPKSTAVVVLAVSLGFCPAAAFAETNEEVSGELKEMRRTLKEFQATIQGQNELIEKQQAKIDSLEQRIALRESAPPAASVQETVPAAPPAGGRLGHRHARQHFGGQRFLFS